jgi:hypothetical protein
VDPQVVELAKAIVGPLLTTGGVATFYLMYRKFEAERAASLREDNKTLREERDAAEKKLRDEREDNDKLRKQIQGDTE